MSSQQGDGHRKKRSFQPETIDWRTDRRKQEYSQETESFRRPLWCYEDTVSLVECGV